MSSEETKYSENNEAASYESSKDTMLLHQGPSNQSEISTSKSRKSHIKDIGNRTIEDSVYSASTEEDDNVSCWENNGDTYSKPDAYVTATQNMDTYMSRNMNNKDPTKYDYQLRNDATFY